MLGGPHYQWVLATALDVARAMQHLHSENIIHSDLKARNILLKSAGNDPRGFSGKEAVSGGGMQVLRVEERVEPPLGHAVPPCVQEAMYGCRGRASQ